MFNLFNIIHITNWDIINHIKDPNEKLAKGALEVDKVKIDGLEASVDKVRDAGIYSRYICWSKNSYLPLGAKIGTTIGFAAGSLMGYKLLQSSLGDNTHSGKQQLV